MSHGKRPDQSDTGHECQPMRELDRVFEQQKCVKLRLSFCTSSSAHILSIEPNAVLGVYSCLSPAFFKTEIPAPLTHTRPSVISPNRRCGTRPPCPQPPPRLPAWLSSSLSPACLVPAPYSVAPPPSSLRAWCRCKRRRWQRGWGRCRWCPAGPGWTPPSPPWLPQCWLLSCPSWTLLIYRERMRNGGM